MSDDEIRAVDGDGFGDADIDVDIDAERPDHDVDAGVDDVQDADATGSDAIETDATETAATEVDEPASGAARASGWQVPEPTGVQAVDEAVEPLLELDHLPTSEHVAYYEVAHRRLQDALADLDGS